MCGRALSASLSARMLFFFFQAEDGIRDADVTGVQTCALPISEVQKHRMASETGQAHGVAGERLEGEIGCRGAGCLGRKHRSGYRQRRTRDRRRTRASLHIAPQEETPSFHFGSSAIVSGGISKQASFQHAARNRARQERDVYSVARYCSHCAFSSRKKATKPGSSRIFTK